MKARALTSDGTWWILDADPDRSKEELINDFARMKDYTLLHTKGTEETYIRKSHVVALMFEE